MPRLAVAKDPWVSQDAHAHRGRHGALPGLAPLPGHGQALAAGLAAEMEGAFGSWCDGEHRL